MSRPTHDPRWEEFCAAARVLGVHPQLVEDDGQYDRNGGALLFALYRTGYAGGARQVGDRSRESQRRCMARLKDRRRSAGLCVECGADAAPWRRCPRCRARANERVKRWHRRGAG